MMITLALNEIGRPLHIHSARSAEEYRALQATFIANIKRAKPFLPWRDPWRYDGPAKTAIVTQGYWKILYCDCGNAPAVEPAWHLACCLECGAIYEGDRLVVPDGWAEIETELLKRPVMTTRNWLPGETIADLERETVAHA